MSNMEPDEGTQAEDQPGEGPRWDKPEDQPAEGPRWDAAEEAESDDANDPDDRADS
jgi:hypothetical protein